MENKTKKITKKYYEKKRNRFMSLRYKSDTAPYPDITAEALADEFGVSKGTISFLERTNLTSEDVLSKSSRILKLYHDRFHCSYEYLFGEAALPLEKHKYITNQSLLSNFDSTTIDNLEQLLTDAEFANFNTYMFKAFLANPTALQGTMDVLFRFMYQLSLIYGDSSLRQGEKELKASSLWFSLNQYMDTYFRDTLMPNLEAGFRKFEAKNEERRKEAEKREIEEGERVQELYEELVKQGKIQDSFDDEPDPIIEEPKPIERMTQVPSNGTPIVTPVNNDNNE